MSSSSDPDATAKENRLSPFNRVLLKVSGESLSEKGEMGFDRTAIEAASAQIKSVHDLGVQVAVVCGGGNLIRGAQLTGPLGIDRGTADYMGMLGTVINSLALQSALEGMGVTTRVLSAIAIDQVVEPYIRRRALRHLVKGRVVILAAGTGNPFVSTDTAAALRARELACEVILKGTKVGGVFDKDPMQHDDALMIERLTYREVITRDIGVMDHTAITMCHESRLPIIVFDMLDKKNVLNVIGHDRSVGTLIAHND